MNRELDGLDRFIEPAVRRLRAGARLVVITFHSLEDRIVKHTLRALERGGEARRQGADQEAGGAGDDEVAAQPAGAQRQAARPRCEFGSEDSADANMEPFEYAIKKDVRNNPIVREVDERAAARAVEVGSASAAFLVLVLLFSAWQHFELLRHGYRLEQMQRERAAEEEIGAPAAPRDRNAAVAEADRDAGDRTAAPGRAGRATKRSCIERVVPAEPPAKSVVAQR